MKSDPLTVQIRRGVSFFSLFHPPQRFRQNQDWFLQVLEKNLAVDVFGLMRFCSLDRSQRASHLPLASYSFQSIFALFLQPGLRTLIPCFNKPVLVHHLPTQFAQRPVVCALFLTLIRSLSEPLCDASSNRLDDGGSERPEGASRATDADSAP